jgi:hypothetical protein
MFIQLGTGKVAPGNVRVGDAKLVRDFEVKLRLLVI